jgi:hypothetical protein
MENRIIWWWDNNTRLSFVNTLTDDPSGPPSDKVHAKQVVAHVDSFLAHSVTPHPHSSL